MRQNSAVITRLNEVSFGLGLALQAARSDDKLSTDIIGHLCNLVYEVADAIEEQDTEHQALLILEMGRALGRVDSLKKK